MTAPVLYPSVARFSGWAKEVATTPGTAVPMTMNLNTDSFVFKDEPVWIKDQATRGSMGNDAYNLVQGPIVCNVTADGPVFVDSFGMLLANIFGDLTVTGTASPFTNKFSLLNPTSGAPTAQPITHTLTAYNGVAPTSGTHLIPYACFSQLVIEFDAASGLLKWSGTATGWKSQVAGSRPTSSPSSVKPQASWVGTMGLGGTVGGAPIVSIQTGKITITREIEPEPVANGSQTPLGITRGGLSVAADFTFLAQDNSVYTHMINNDQPQVQILFSSGSTQQVQFDMQQYGFTVTDHDYGNKAVRWATSGMPIFNSTNAGASGGQSPMSATLVNAIASGTYI